MSSLRTRFSPEKAFEKKFEQELTLFKGKINPFEDATELINEYF